MLESYKLYSKTLLYVSKIRPFKKLWYLEVWWLSLQNICRGLGLLNLWQRWWTWTWKCSSIFQNWIQASWRISASLMTSQQTLSSPTNNLNFLQHIITTTFQALPILTSWVQHHWFILSAWIKMFSMKGRSQKQWNNQPAAPRTFLLQPL